MTDNWTPDDPNDDVLASFSAAGPTVEGFIKPEMVAPGGHLLGMMDESTTIPTEHPGFHNRNKYFSMSGTSQAAAVVSGTAALMLELDPTLQPDDLKCRLVGTARSPVDAAGAPVYSVFQQGAGMIDAYEAAHSTNSGCVNGGLDVEADLLGIEHYGGPAYQDDSGNFYVVDDGGGARYFWDGSSIWDSGYLWFDAYLWNDADVWDSAYLWNDDYPWIVSYLWFDSYVWSANMSETMAINLWVEGE
jgi:subtilisin family serine protease